MMNAGDRLPGTPEPMHLWPGADGLRIAADCWGDPSDPLIVLVHGGGQSRHAWASTGRTLGAAGWHAVAFDLRGHGDSDWAPDADYSLDAYVRDLQALLRRLGGCRPVLVGASLGASAALIAAGEGAVHAGALIMVDFVARTEPAAFERNRSFMTAHGEGFGSLEEVANAIAAFRGGDSAQRPARLDGLARVVRRRADGRYQWHWDPRMIPWREREYPTRRQRMEVAARALTAPLLLIRGGRSEVVSEEGAREFLALVPEAEYAVIEGAGHMIAGDRNDSFGHAAGPFLERLRARM